jgi:hypothetical protein
MPMYSRLDEKIDAIKSSFAPLMHQDLTRFETAELQFQDGTWDAWPDLPIRLYSARAVVSIAWWEFDDLWITNDESNPFSMEGSVVRRVENAIDILKPAIGGRFNAVLIGRGEMSVEGRDIEIWTRIVIQIGDHWIEIFNALDENGFDFHLKLPAGEFVRCL